MCPLANPLHSNLSSYQCLFDLLGGRFTQTGLRTWSRDSIESSLAVNGKVTDQYLMKPMQKELLDDQCRSKFITITVKHHHDYHQYHRYYYQSGLVIIIITTSPIITSTFTYRHVQYTQAHTDIHTHVLSRRHTCTQRRICTHAHTYIHTCSHRHMYKHCDTDIHTHVLTQTYMHTSTYRHTCTHKYIRSHIYFQCFFSNTPELAAHKLFPIKTTFLLLAIADLFRFLTKVEMSADVTFKIWMKANGGRKEWQTDTHQFPSTHQALTKSIWEIQSVTLVKSLLLANAQIT